MQRLDCSSMVLEASPQWLASISRCLNCKEIDTEVMRRVSGPVQLALGLPNLMYVVDILECI